MAARRMAKAASVVFAAVAVAATAAAAAPLECELLVGAYRFDLSRASYGS